MTEIASCAPRQSFGDDGKYHKCEISGYFDYTPYDPMEITDEVRESVGISTGTGTLVARGATVVVPPTSTANVSRHGPRSSARDHTILAVKEVGRRRWKQTSGYHGQARVENAFFRYKSIIGDSLRACSSAGRGTEVVLACNILNQMTGLGRPMSYRIDR